MTSLKLVKAHYYSLTAPIVGGGRRVPSSQWTKAYCLSKVIRYETAGRFKSQHKALAAHIEKMGWHDLYDNMRPTQKPGPTKEAWRTRVVSRGPSNAVEEQWLMRQRAQQTEHWNTYLAYQAAIKRAAERKEHRRWFDYKLDLLMQLVAQPDYPIADSIKRIDDLAMFPSVRALGSRDTVLTDRATIFRTIPTYGEAMSAIEFVPEFNLFAYKKEGGDLDREIKPGTMFICSTGPRNKSSDKLFLLWRAKSWLLLGNPLGYVPSTAAERDALLPRMTAIVEKMNDY